MSERICANPEDCCRELSRVWAALGNPPSGTHCYARVETLVAQLAALQQENATLRASIDTAIQFRLKNLDATCPDCEVGCDHGASHDVLICGLRAALTLPEGQ